jgi:sulfoxide reductase catalytic subunit YedY
MKEPDKISASEITAPEVYLNRRNFMRAGVLAATAIATGSVYHRLNHVSANAVVTSKLEGVIAAPDASSASAGFNTTETRTSFQDITHYNNFYEFSTDKGEVAEAAAQFDTKGWQLSVGGLVNKPKVFDLEELLRLSAPEERVYRMRCVEGWSMVIPWAGFPLAKLLDRVEPLSAAKYVAFETLNDPLASHRRQIRR